MLIIKEGITGSDCRQYIAKIICEERKTIINVYIIVEDQEIERILIGSDYYYGEPETEQLVWRIKFIIKRYEEKSSQYPTLIDWDGKIECI